MMLPTWYLVLLGGVLGVALGSFLNVCTFRWAHDLSVVRPRSRCGSCGTPIANRDNIPVLSWLLLRGRCRSCGAAISVQYPLVELAVAAIWAAAAWRHGASIEALQMGAFLTILLGIAITDAREMLIPDQFTLGGGALGLLLAALAGEFLPALAGAALGYLLLWGVKLAAEKALGKPALGVGDIHMMVLVGAFTGAGGVILTLLLGSVLGLVVSLPLLLLSGRFVPGETRIPLGVFLAAAAVVTFFWGDPLITWYVGLFR